MIDFKEEMKSILDSDPLGLLEVKVKASQVVNTNDRLVASFEEINEFMRTNGNEPKASRDIGERKLASRLKGIRSNLEKVLALLEFDTFDLLKGAEEATPSEIESIGDVLNDDALGLLGDKESGQDDIFAIKNFRKPSSQSEENAKRKSCKEFDQFEPLFKQAQADLSSKKKKIIPFNSELQIQQGEIFALQGMLVYVANIGDKKKKNFGNVNARLYCVFDNGTESHLLLRSLAAAFWKDENSGQLVDSVDKELFETPELVTKDDKATGYIYVLKSLSDDPQIKEISDLHKIGFSRNPVSERIEGAELDPTYLMANVRLISQFETFNINPQKFESLIHRFFGEVCLNVDVFDKNGKRHIPREWFIVPFHVIEIVVNLLITGEIVNYYYDTQRQEIVGKG